MSFLDVKEMHPDLKKNTYLYWGGEKIKKNTKRLNRKYKKEDILK